MRGKVGLVIGLGIGYVLGTRAGRERYEQIKAQAARLWNLEPVQKQVGKAKDFAKSSAMALPNALWDGATKVVKSAGDAAKSAGDAARSASDAAKSAGDAARSAAKDTGGERS